MMFVVCVFCFYVSEGGFVLGRGFLWGFFCFFSQKKLSEYVPLVACRFFELWPEVLTRDSQRSPLDIQKGTFLFFVFVFRRYRPKPRPGF